MTETSSSPIAPPPAPPRGRLGPAGATPRIDIVVPVYNEAAGLEGSVRRLHAFLGEAFPFVWRIVIADNASTDTTPELARALAAQLPEVSVLHLAEKGRGRALRAAWSASDADVLAYMDVDLSTDLTALFPLVAGLVSGHSDVAIGTRLAPGSRVRRGPRREFISRSYNRILRVGLGARFSDAQCGFKAIRADAARQLLPLIADEAWFFDTELLVLAQRRGLRIHEVAVDWTDDPDSRVEIVATAVADLRGVARLALASPVVRFVLIGLASTLAYAGLFLALRQAMAAGVANAIALAVTAVANTQANRHFTFDLRGRPGLLRQHAAGALVYLLALGLTAGALDVLRGLDSDPSRLLEVTVLIVASAFATVSRYVALRSWIFAPPALGPGARSVLITDRASHCLHRHP